MKILYYTWGEWMKEDVVNTLQTLGETVTVFDKKIDNYDKDPEFQESLKEELKKGYDAIFTMDYIPLLSEMARDEGVLYVSWISDCPNLTLYSDTVQNECNRIFVFDELLYKELKAKGVRVRHLPLGVNVSRLDTLLGPVSKEANYQHEISFVGSFYQNGYRQLEKVETMPQELKGYIDGVVSAQNLIYGYDMVSELFDEAHVKQLESLAPVNLGENYNISSEKVYHDWIRKEVTVMERERLIEDLGLLFHVDVATEKMPTALESLSNIKNLGYVDYRNEMPKIFRESKINLNFTLRTIQSGLPLRLTDVLGAGGFLITNYQPELPYYFENGNSIVWFESREHLLDLCAFYSRQEKEREKIRNNGYNIVKKAFSYERLLKILLDSLTE